MLEVKVILHHAVTGEVREVANMRIVNDGTGSPAVGNYDVEAWIEPPPTRGRQLRVARVEDHRRTSSVLALVHKAIEAVYGR